MTACLKVGRVSPVTYWTQFHTENALFHHEYSVVVIIPPASSPEKKEKRPDSGSRASDAKTRDHSHVVLTDQLTAAVTERN